MNKIIKYLKPFQYLGLFYVIVSLILRVVFLFHPITTSSFGFFEIVKMFLIGIVSDGYIFCLASSFLAIYFLFLSNKKYESPWGWIILGSFVCMILYVWLVPNNIFKQYGGSLVEIVLSFLLLKTILFAVMLFIPKRRIQMRNILYFVTISIYVLLIIFNAVSEYFFWNEFGVRYNFIAVDYLIYTNEVIGNIMESYPIIPLFSCILLVSLVVSVFIYNRTKSEMIHLPNLTQKIKLLLSFVVLCVVSVFGISLLGNYRTNDIFETEIQSNGIYRFYYAFTHSELDFMKFYSTLPQKEAEKEYLNLLKTAHLPREIKNTEKEIHKNVILISVESLSADFLEHYGNQQKIMPFLDSLAEKSLFFTNFYATGNRTVRGLEALSLCIPPTPGESVVKRDDNQNKFSIGSVFKSKGYQVKYLYGGYSTFDNMQNFFSGNGYDIVDRNRFAPDEISFANIWGVCDEDMAKKIIKTANEDAKKSQPFFYHWMTVSNHRPFTYPEGKIDIPSNIKSREGGVKYTDYALKNFFREAKKQPWYQNTIFVIVADHCASSSGKTSLPMDKYRIPAIIFSENFVQPQKFTKLTSQIDLMPTLLGLLHFNYSSKFLGQDVLKEDYEPRAFIATYQDLGYIKDDVLTVISPVKKIQQFQLKQKEDKLPKEFRLLYDEIPMKTEHQDLIKETISIYETVSNWLKNKKLNKI